MLILLTGDAEVVLQPIFWLLVALLIVGAIITEVLAILWLFARWYWMKRSSTEQLSSPWDWEERPRTEQTSLSLPPEEVIKTEPAKSKEQSHLDKEAALNRLLLEKDEDEAEPQALRAKASSKRSA